MELVELEKPQRWQQPSWGMSQEGTLTMSNSKTCTKCGQILPIALFGRDSKFKDGLRSVCKPCNNSQATKYYVDNKTAINKKKAEKFAGDMLVKPEEVRLKARLRQASYRKTSPLKVKTFYQNWLKNNPGANYQATKKWRLANPHKVTEANMRRRALKMSAVTYLVTEKDIQRIMSKPCAYCGNRSEHLDHVIPLSRNGTHGIGNLIGACASCNTSKNNKFIMEWRKKWS